MVMISPATLMDLQLFLLQPSPLTQVCFLIRRSTCGNAKTNWFTMDFLAPWPPRSNPSSRQRRHQLRSGQPSHQPTPNIQRAISSKCDKKIDNWSKGNKSINEYFQGLTTKFDQLAILGKLMDLENQVEKSTRWSSWWIQNDGGSDWEQRHCTIACGASRETHYPGN